MFYLQCLPAAVFNYYSVGLSGCCFRYSFIVEVWSLESDICFTGRFLVLFVVPVLFQLRACIFTL